MTVMVAPLYIIAGDDFEIAAEVAQAGNLQDRIVHGPRGAVAGSPAGEQAGQRAGHEVVDAAARLEARFAEEIRRRGGIELAFVLGLVTFHEARDEQAPHLPGEAMAAGIERVEDAAGLQ